MPDIDWLLVLLACSIRQQIKVREIPAAREASEPRWLRICCREMWALQVGWISTWLMW